MTSSPGHFADPHSRPSRGDDGRHYADDKRKVPLSEGICGQFHSCRVSRYGFLGLKFSVWCSSGTSLSKPVEIGCLKTFHTAEHGCPDSGMRLGDLMVGSVWRAT